MKLIIDLHYFTPVNVIFALAEKTHIVFDIYENYAKMGFRNRCQVAGGNGIINLSVPLVDGRNQRRPVKEVKIDNRRNWQREHWRTLVSCYNRSPWFEFYRDDLEQLYTREHEFLADWNLACWYWLSAQLQLDIETGVTTSWQEQYPDEVPDLRNRLLPANIGEVLPVPIHYNQVFEDRLGFLPNLSALDLLFCEGRQSLQLIKKYKIPS